MTRQELAKLYAFLEAVYPELYGYTDYSRDVGGMLPYLFFRNRDESFDKHQAIVVAMYWMED